MNDQPKDTFATRVVVLTLAFVVCGGMGAITFLAFTQTVIPDALDRLVFAGLGAIGTLLSKTALSVIQGPTEVEVMNQDSSPVPVSDPTNVI